MLAQSFAFHSSIALGIRLIIHLQPEKSIELYKASQFIRSHFKTEDTQSCFKLIKYNKRALVMNTPNIVWTRIDERLLHGQIRITWG